MHRISELEDNQRNIVLEFILVKYLEAKNTKENGHIDVWLAGDESGTIEFGMWNCVLNVGDVMYLNGGYVSPFQGRRRLYVSKVGSISRVRTLRKVFKVSECHEDLVKDLLAQDRQTSEHK